MNRIARSGLCVLGLSLAGCSPSLDWRQVSVDAASTVLMPCKPDRVERRTTFAGMSADGVMWSCEAGGFNWSTTTLRFRGDAEAAAAQGPLGQALAANLGSSSLPPDAGAASAASGRWRVDGRRPDGRPVRAWIRVSRDGAVLYQQVILSPDGGAPSGDAQDTFLAGPERRARP